MHHARYFKYIVSQTKMSLQIKLPLLGKRGYKTKSQSSFCFPFLIFLCLYFSKKLSKKKNCSVKKKIYLTLGYLLHMCYIKTTVTSLFPLTKNRNLRFHVFDSWRYNMHLENIKILNYSFPNWFKDRSTGITMSTLIGSK